MSIKLTASSGFTLVEMLIAIVIIGIGVTGVMVAYSTSVKGSANALIGKQLVAIADEMMEEILLKPYNSTLASGSGVALCGAGTANRSAFDDVGDYNGYQTSGICTIDGQTIPGLESYNVSVVVINSFNLSGVANTLRVTVTATHGADRMILDGFKVNMPPAVP